MFTTNSKTLLPLNDRDIRSILVNFLEGQCSLSELQDNLRQSIIVDFDITKKERRIKNINIPANIVINVNATNIQHMLQRYINQEISSLDLSNWAAFIYMAPFYVPEGATEEERSEAGESILWDIIQRLATPVDSIKIDSALAQEYLKLISV